MAVFASQSTAAEAQVQLPEVTVTATPFGDGQGYTAKSASSATKTTTPIMETPVAIQVVPREVIDDRKPTSILEVVKNVSGIQAPPGGYYDNFYIRGFSTVVDTYRNGLKLNSMRGVPDMAFVDHVEVAKGPSSMLYGRVQPGGIVNSVTKKPQATAAYSVQQEFGSWGNSRTIGDATGALNEDRSLMYRVIGVYDKGDSWVDFQHHKNTAVAAYLTWIPSPRFELNVQIEGYDKKQANVAYTSQQIPQLGARPANLPRNWTQNDPIMWSTYPATEKSTLLSYDWTFAINDAWKLTNRLGYSDLDDAQSMMTPLAFTAATGTMTRRINYNLVTRRILTTNLDLVGEFMTGDIKHKLLVGLDYVSHRTTYKGYRQAGAAATPGVPALNIFNPVYGNINTALLSAAINPSLNNVLYYQNMDDKGLYVQDQMSLGSRWELLLGVRQDRTFDPVTKLVGTTTAACYPNCDGALDPATPTERALSPRAGLLYKISSEASVYGSYSKSFGNSNSSALTFDGSRPPPQIGIQYELGAKTSLMDNKVTTSVTLFDLYQRNRMTPDLAHVGFSLPVGEVRSKGLEFDVAGQVSKHVSLIGSYTYNDAKVTKDNTAGATATLGKRWYGVPMNAATFWAKYDTAPGSKEGWAFGGGVYLNGQRQGNNINTFQLPGYGRVDAMLSYRTKAGGYPVTAQLNVQNLFDKWYFEATDGSTNSYYGSPRAVTATVNVGF
jgi:iron complex outermembrane receptor protein